MAVMGSLRAFRKPEVSIMREIPESSSLQSQGQGPEAKPVSIVATTLRVHSEDEKESLPLALHHSPLMITLGIFQDLPGDGDTSSSTGHVSTLTLLDPSKEEEADMNGYIVFSINAQSEICAISKPGGCGLSAAEILQVGKIACTPTLQHIYISCVYTSITYR